MNNLDLPPVWFVAFGLVSWLLARFAPLATFGSPDWLGWAIVLLGIAWAVSANILLARARTTFHPRHKPTALVVDYSFRVNRNPIYTGMTAVLFGWALVLGTISALLPVIAFPIIITRRFVLKEEQNLRDAFGREAEHYLSRTRRW